MINSNLSDLLIFSVPCLTIDVILNFRTTFVSGSGQVVFKPREIATHYLRTWFIIDVVAALPLDSILKLLDENQNRALKQIQLLKIVRLLRLAKVFHKVETLNTYGFVALLLCVVIFFIMAHWAACLWFWIGYHSLNVAISEFAENGTNLQMLGNVGGLEIDPSNFDQSGVSDVMSKSGYNIEDHLTLSMSWLVKLADDLSKPYFLKMVMDESGNRDNNHEAGSLLNSKSVVGSNSSSSTTSDNDTESPTIIRKIILSQGPNQSQYYVSSLYFTLSSLTSVGFGNIAPNTDLEKKFAIAIMFIGALLHAVVFGHVSSIIQRMHAKSSNFDVKMNNLKEFIRIHHMPRTLKNRIMEYNQAIWSNHNGIDPKEMLKEFPEKLQAEVSLHLHREVFNLPVFQNASKGCLRFLSLHVKEIFVVPGEYLIHHGDPLTAIYLVVSGSLEVVQSQTLTKSNIVAILGKGDLFGLSVQSTPTNDDTFAIPQESFLQNVKSTCDVKALSYCVLQCISKEGVETMLETYPEFRQRFARDLMADYSCSLWSTNEDDLSSSDDEEDSEKENIDTCSNTSYALVPAVTVCPKFHPNGSSSALSSLLGGLPDLITAPIDCMKSPECRSIHQSVIAAAADSTDETMLRVPCGSTSNRTISQGSDMSVTITTGGSQSDNDNSVIIRHDSETSDGIPSSNSLQKDVELPSSSSGNYLTLDNYHPPRFKSSIVIRKKQIRDNPENTNITARKNPVESDSAIYMKTNNTIHEVDELELDNDTFITALPDQILATKKMNRHSYCSGERSIVLGDRKVRFNEIPIYYDSKPISCRSLNKSESSGKLFGRPASIKFSKRPSQLLMAVQCKSTVSKEPDISILGAKESCLVNPLRFGSRRLATISSNDASSEGIRSKETTAENLDANEDPMNELAKGMESKINFSKNDIIKRQLNVQEKKEPDLDQSEESKTITTSSIKEDSPSSPTKTLLDVDEDQDKKQNDLHEFLEDCVINTNLLNKNNLGFVNRPRVATVAPLQAAQTESSISDMLIEPTSNESDQRYISLLPPIIVQDQVSDSGIALDQSKPPETVDQTTITVVPDRFEPERSNPCSPIEDEQDQKSTSDINKGYNQIAKNIQNNHSNTYLNTQSNHQHYYNTHTDSNEIRSLSLQIVQLTSQVVSMKNNEIEVQKQLLELQKTVKTTNDSMLAILNKMNTKMDRMESAQQQAYAQSIQATHAHIHDALSNCVNCSRTGSVTNSCSSVYAGMRKGSRTSIFSDRNSISAMSLLAEDDFERPMQGIQNETRERKEKNIIGLPTCSSNAPMSNKRDRKLSQTSMLGLKIENEMANSSLHAAHKPKSFCKSSSTHANPLQRRRGARDLNLNPESTSLLDTATYNKHNHGHRNSINYINLEADSQDKPGKELQGNSNSNTLNFDRPAISITSTQNLNEPKTNQSPTPKINANMTQIAEVVQSFMQSSSLNSSLNTGNSNAIGRSKSPDVKNQSSSSSMLFTQRANSSSLFLSGHESRRNSKDDRDKDKDKDRNRSNSSTFGSYKLNNKLKQTAEFIRSRNSSQHSQEKNRDQDSFSTGKHKFKNIGEEIRRSRLKSLSSPRLEGGAANQSTNEGKDVVKSPVKPVVYRPK